MLDLIGDLALLGWPVLGHVIATKSGHGQHLALMREIAANPDAWEFVELKKNGKGSVMEKVAESTMESMPILVRTIEPALA